MADGTLSVQVPSLGNVLAPDGAIQDAFAALDAQMEAWLAAMKRAEQALRDRAAMPAEAVARSVEPSAANALSDDERSAPASATVEPLCNSGASAAQVEPECQAEPITTAQTPEQVADDVNGASVADEQQESIAIATPATSEAQTALQTQTVLQTQTMLQAQAEPVPAASAEQAPSAPAAVSVPDAPASSAEKQRAEDEALLASLDEETAKAIRVMRRLCMNTKSVKELLAEYEAKKESQAAAAASAKRSWFRRGK